MKTRRIPTNGAASFGSNPFAALDLGELPNAPAPPPPAPVPMSARNLTVPPRKPVHLRIEKSGRSGKCVTVLHGAGIEILDDAGRRELLHTLKTKLGVGGTVSTGFAPNSRTPVPTLEIQGDERPRIAEILASCGFK